MDRQGRYTDIKEEVSVNFHCYEVGGFVKKVVTWLAVASGIVFVIAWAIGGLMIYEGNYENYAWAYVGLGSLIVFFCSLLYLRLSRCPHCGRLRQSSGKYCPYCGKEID